MKHTHTNKVSTKELVNLLKKHKRIKVMITESDGKGHVQRERILTSDGKSKVRYASVIWKSNADGSYIKDDKGQAIFDRYEWSKYGRSCFMGYLDKEHGDKTILALKSKAERVVKAMKKHDRKYYVVEAVYAGKKFTHKVG